MVWTDDEDQVLRERYPLGGVRAVRERLPHRGGQAIRCRATRLGVAYLGDVWQCWEDEILRACYRDTSARYVRDTYLPHRTLAAVRLRAYNLGLTPNRRSRYRCGKRPVVLSSDYYAGLMAVFTPWRK